MKLFLFSLVTCLSFSVSAQIGKQKVHTMSFGEEFVPGQTAKPNIELILQKKNNNYSRMIKLRNNFNSELRRSAESIQAKR